MSKEKDKGAEGAQDVERAAETAVPDVGPDAGAEAGAAPGPAAAQEGAAQEGAGQDAAAEGAAPASKARWYIVHTYSGFEQRVEQTLREMVRTGQAEGLIEEIVVPTEKVIELVKGEKRTSTRKFYPGYVMIKMVMNDTSWHLVQDIPRVTGFIGGKTRPTPMRDSEAVRILSMMEKRQEQPRPKFHFDRGDEVRVIDGPFGGFNGVVEDVNYDKGKLRVAVSIFGRQTPVELDFVQVTKG